MRISDLRLLCLLSSLLFTLTGCIGADSSEDVDTSCPTSTTPSTTLPAITYTEEAETSSSNDAIGDAQSIQTNTIVSGYVTHPSMGNCNVIDCDDYYAVDVTEGEEFEIVLSGDTATNFDLYLYDGSNFSVYSQNSTSEEKLLYTIPSGMTQLVILVNAIDGTGNYTLTVTTPEEPQEITEVPAAPCLANLNGTISDAVDGSVLEGATINLREGKDNKTGEIAYTTSSDANGNYSFTDVDADTYTAEIALSGYISEFVKLPLPGEQTTEKKFPLSPTLPEGQVRIVLAWGASPYDLDSHLTGPKSTSGTFTVNYLRKTGDGAQLDRDSTYGYGPETITITTQNTGTYSYKVVDYAAQGTTSSTSLSTSGAVVTVYNSTGIMKKFTVPTSGTGYNWNVFTLNGDTLTTVNTITSD
ncbi:MAG: carboxypeptidase regulatory-like domain-containing protein [Oceanospirillaceae bacterium]|nr:carboxypeptidase regulatory-like domain-containing protein [Oceanospirillaceae bacterium]